MKLDDINESIPSIDYFVERKCLPTWALPQAAISFHDLTYVVAGESVYWVNDKPYPLKRGDLVYIPKGSLRRAATSADTPMHCYAFNFQLAHPSGGEPELPLPTTIRIPDDNNLLYLYKEFNSSWLDRGEGYLLQCRALFMLILYRILQYTLHGGPVPSDARIAKVKAHILQYYHERLETAYLAAIVSLHPVYFGNWFQKNTGYTVKEYINRVRINKARDLLSTGGCSVSEAAFRCGFEDAFYFSRVFKKLTGRNPSELIK